MSYTIADKETLKMRVQVIILNHEIKGKNIVESVALLKSKKLSKEEIDMLRKFCEAHGLDYDKIKKKEKQHATVVS